MSSVNDILPGTQVEEIFYHTNSGLTTSSFTTTLFRNGVQDSSTGITISEIATNFYKVSFTIDSSSGVLWEIDIYETANPDDGRYQGTWRARGGVPANVVQTNGATYTDSAEIQYIKTFVENIYSAVQKLFRGLN
jgi:hypothetical protein